MTSESEKINTGGVRLVNRVNKSQADQMPKKGSKQYCELITKIEGGEPFTRKIKVNDRPYYQLCRYIYLKGKRKLKIIKHLGTRKPRRSNA